MTKINFYFDDDPKPFTISTRPTHDRQDFDIKGKKAKKSPWELAEWEKSGKADVIGIDNFGCTPNASDAFSRNVKPLLNIGGLVRLQPG